MGVTDGISDFRTPIIRVSAIYVPNCAACEFVSIYVLLDLVGRLTSLMIDHVFIDYFLPCQLQIFCETPSHIALPSFYGLHIHSVFLPFCRVIEHPYLWPGVGRADAVSSNPSWRRSSAGRVRHFGG